MVIRRRAEYGNIVRRVEPNLPLKKMAHFKYRFVYCYLKKINSFVIQFKKNYKVRRLLIIVVGLLLVMVLNTFFGPATYELFNRIFHIDDSIRGNTI